MCFICYNSIENLSQTWRTRYLFRYRTTVFYAHLIRLFFSILALSSKNKLMQLENVWLNGNFFPRSFYRVKKILFLINGSSALNTYNSSVTLKELRAHVEMFNVSKEKRYADELPGIYITSVHQWIRQTSRYIKYA